MRKREQGKVSSRNKKNNQKKKIIPKKIKSNPESRLSDLEKTLDINIQILKTFYQSNNPSNKSQTKEQLILTAIENINKKY